ncbi:MAG TPA: hypothetical protein VHQ47_12540 [Phycisphaerae bacterium]|nr:hypothetical protein [Phycisphaerae bacterium]
MRLNDQCILFSNRFRRQLRFSALVQIALCMLAAIVLDDGYAVRLFLIALATYWIACGIVIVRRPGALCVGDRLIVRWGCLIFFVLAAYEAFIRNNWNVG